MSKHAELPVLISAAGDTQRFQTIRCTTLTALADPKQKPLQPYLESPTLLWEFTL